MACRAWLVVALAVLMLAAVAEAEVAERSRLGDTAPEITAGSWINSAPLTIRGLGGRVVLLEFWTFG